MIKRFMNAVEFNVWMSVIKLIGDYVNSNSSRYGINITPSDIKPSFPRDLSKFTKPSIIIQKVDTTQSLLCFGGFAGQYYDEDTDTYMDVSGTNHLSTFQIDVFADSNTQCSLLISMVTEDVLNQTNDMPIYDFTNGFDDPSLIGYGKVLHNDIEITNLDSNNNDDYRTAIRFDINTVQVVVPDQEFVDLSKIKITFHFTI